MYVLGFWANAGGALVTLKNIQDLILHVGHTSVYLNPWLHVIQDMREELNKVHRLMMQCAEMGKLSTMQDKRWVQQCCLLQRLDHCWFPQRRLEMMEPRKPLVRDWKALWVTEIDKEKQTG
jgi:hypothetical protein